MQNEFVHSLIFSNVRMCFRPCVGMSVRVCARPFYIVVVDLLFLCRLSLFQQICVFYANFNEIRNINAIWFLPHSLMTDRVAYFTVHTRYTQHIAAGHVCMRVYNVYTCMYVTGCHLDCVQNKAISGATRNCKQTLSTREWWWWESEIAAWPKQTIWKWCAESNSHSERSTHFSLISKREKKNLFSKSKIYFNSTSF